MSAHLLEAAVAAAWPPERWNDVTTLVGVSGGPDSVALLRALQQLQIPGKGRLVVAYFDHRWRAESSGAELDFVRELAEKLDLQFESGSPELGSTRSGSGREGGARKQRFDFFERTAEILGARYLALGHTRDDQVETVLHRILRGTGPVGLAGIPLFRSWGSDRAVVHPLLNLTRANVLEYLDSLRQPYQLDPTNDDLKLTRNRIRHSLLPRLRAEFNPQVDSAILRLSDWAESYLDWQSSQLDPLIEAGVSSISCSRLVFECEPLAAQPLNLVAELLRRLWREQSWPLQSMKAEHWIRLAEMTRPNPPDLVSTFPGEVRAERTGGQLIVQMTKASR